jgi:c-di-GMP-binding flagellar brake protein YcgR
MGRPILLQARVVARVQDGEVCKVRFQFQDPERLDALLHPSAWRVFNRRQSYRVAPRQSERIDVAVGWKDKKRIGVLVDVSVSGIAVRIPWSGDEPLARGEPVAVGFRLPECETPIVAVTSLRNVSEEKGFARWGLEFDVRHSKGWVPKERRIVEYLMRRQREELAETRQRDDDDEERRTA